MVTEQRNDEAPDLSAGRSTRSEWRPWWPVFTVTGTFCLVLQCTLPGELGFFLTLPTLFGFPLAAGCMLIVAVVEGIRRQWRRSLSIACAAVLPALLWQPIRTGADYAHLALTAWFGLGQIGYVPAPPRDAFTAYDWSIGLCTTPATFLLYDPSDEIAAPPAQHRRPLGEEKGFADGCAGRSDHLIGHYYVCTF